jgi:hypothetical protein
MQVGSVGAGVWTTIRRLSPARERLSTDAYVRVLEWAGLLIPRSYPYYGDDFF